MKSKAEIEDAAEALLLCEDMLAQSYKDGIDREDEFMEVAEQWRIPTEEFSGAWDEWRDKKEIEEWNVRPNKPVSEKKAAVKEVVREEPKVADGIKPAVRDIEAEIKAKAEAEIAKGRASLKNSEVQPRIEKPKIEGPKVTPKIGEAGSFKARALRILADAGKGEVVQLKPREQFKPREQEKPEPEEFEPCLEDVRLNLDAPYDVAKTFVRLSEDAEGKKRYVFVGIVEGKLVKVPTLRRWKGDFKRWNGQYYEDVGDEDIRTEMYEFLDRGDGGRIKPKPKNVNEVIDGLKAGTNLAGDAPCWIGREGPEPKGLLVCRNGLLELETGKLWEHDPRLFCLNGVDFDFDAKARAPRWEQFLREVLPRDEESVGTLQEFFGLWLTDVTKYHKALGIFGQPRSGKGTVGRVVKGLLGTSSFAPASLQSLGSEFGMEHLIGKKLALIPDVKLDGRMNITLIMQRLLETMGEDDQPINRKNEKFWLGKLSIRLLILGNDIPKFRGADEAGALAARMITLKMDQSYLGKEDWDLTDKLLAERAGILNWAIEGWRRLRIRDRFVQPKSGVELLQKLRANTSTIGMFVEECCELGTEFRVEHAILWAAFCEWSDRRKLALTLSTNTFSGALHGVFDSITTGRPRTGMPDNRPPHQYGLKLKDGWCSWRR